MSGIKSGMRLSLCLLGLVMASASFASSDEIEVVKAEGSVATTVPSEKQEKAVGSKSVLAPKNVLTTGPNGRAVVRMGNAGYIVLQKNSKVELGDPRDHAGFMRQLTGMVYYALNTIKGKDNLEVRTKTATIGVRGTRFLVTDLPERNEIGMRKGVVSVASPEGEFEIHRKAEQDEFEAYKQEARDAMAKQQREFEEYKARTDREFVEYKREFSLGANRMASFDGKRVVDRPLSAETEQDMQTIEAYAEEWLKEVRD
jgi:hypothetical protein